MSDENKNNVYRVVIPVYPVVEQSHAKILEEAGFLNKDGYLNLLSLLHSNVIVERQYQLRITIASVSLGILCGLALKFLL